LQNANEKINKYNEQHKKKNLYIFSVLSGEVKVRKVDGIHDNDVLNINVRLIPS